MLWYAIPLVLDPLPRERPLVSAVLVPPMKAVGHKSIATTVCKALFMP